MLALLRRAVLLDLEKQFKRKIDHDQLFNCLGLNSDFRRKLNKLSWQRTTMPRLFYCLLELSNTILDALRHIV